MKIIVKNQQEYNELMRACQLIHDFTVWTPVSCENCENIKNDNCEEECWLNDGITLLEDGTKICVTYQQEDTEPYVGEVYTASNKPGGTAGICIPFDEYPVLHLLAAIYDTPEDAEWKKDVIFIKDHNSYV